MNTSRAKTVSSPLVGPAPAFRPVLRFSGFGRRIGLILFGLGCASLTACAQEQDQVRGAPAESADAPEIRAQIVTAEGLLATTPDRAAVLYFLASSHALLHETLPALKLLKECLAAKEGFDPSGDSSFGELKTSRDFQQLVEQVHKDFPAIHQSKIAFTSAEKDLFPEGLAYDSKRDSFYLSSLHQKKIVKIPRQDAPNDLVPSGRDPLLPILGIRLDPADGTIWCASSSEASGRSELLHFDGAGLLLGRFTPPEPGPHGFNDLVVLRNGAVYLTDTIANKIYRYDPKSRAFAALPLVHPLFSPNGIALTDDEQFLYVADQFGVLRIGLGSGGSSWVVAGPRSTLAGIDGLYWHQGSLIAVQNGIGTPRVALFRLTPDGLGVLKTTVVENFLKTPTTGAICGDQFYFIVNSEIDNLNGEHILDLTKLKPVVIAKVHLP